jgi:hypothetical protein
MVKSLIRSIFEEKPQALQATVRPEEAKEGGESGSELRGLTIGEQLYDPHTLARSVFEAEALNTNSFDIRYFEKEKAKEEGLPLETEVVRMGSSLLLSNLPHVEDLTSGDPLRISRLLLSTIEEGARQEKRVVREEVP